MVRLATNADYFLLNGSQRSSHEGGIMSLESVKHVRLKHKCLGIVITGTLL
jgi:hypothetical protein